MKIGLLSDTHSYLDNKIHEYFTSCDEIWHAGDIGDPAVLHQLQTWKPVRAVYGNIDEKVLQTTLPEDCWFTCGELTVLMTHIAGAPPNYNPRIKQLLKSRKADILVCGHSHILRVVKDPAWSMLYINPGAAGNHGFHHVKTILRFTIDGKQLKDMEVIELGKRGAL